MTEVLDPRPDATVPAAATQLAAAPQVLLSSARLFRLAESAATEVREGDPSGAAGLQVLSEQAGARRDIALLLMGLPVLERVAARHLQETAR